MNHNKLLKEIDLERIKTNESLSASNISYALAMERLEHLNTMIDILEVCKVWDFQQHQYPETREGLYGAAVVRVMLKELYALVKNRLQILGADEKK